MIAPIIELISIPFQIAAELISGVLGAFFHTAFAKQELDENGQPVPYQRPTNRWQIFAYSLMGTLILSLLVGGICFLICQSWFWTQFTFWSTAFLGVIGAIKAAVP